MALQDIEEEELEQAFVERQEPEAVTVLEPAVVVSGASSERAQDAAKMLESFGPSSEALLPPLPDVRSVHASPTPPMSPETPETSSDSVVMSGMRVGSEHTSGLHTAYYPESFTSPIPHHRQRPVGSPFENAETVVSASLGSTGTAESVLSGAIDNGSEPNTSFDLSKALEIPHDSTIPTSNSNSNSNPISPIMSSPKISFKKKFSSTLLPAANATPTENPNSSDGGGAGANTTAKATITSSDFSLHHLQRHGSVRSKNNASEIPRVNSSSEHHTGLGIEHPGVDNVNRNLLRKYSLGSSSSSSRSFQENDDLTFRPPPALLEGDAGSLASLHDFKSPRSSLNYSEAADNASAKKAPLLKRASSAILRKTSLSNRNSSSHSPKLMSPPSMNPSNYHELRQTASFSKIPYEAAATDKEAFGSGFRNLKKLSLNTNGSPNRCVSNPDGLQQVTSLPTPPIGNSFISPTNNQSLGSKFRHGLTRMISGGVSDIPKAGDGYHNMGQNQRSTSGLNHISTSVLPEHPLASAFKDSTGMGSFETVPYPGDERSIRKSASLTRRSSTSPPSFNGPGTDQATRKTQLSKKNTSHSAGSVTTVRNNSVFSAASADSLSQGSETEIITVDIDEITKVLPVITVTEKVGARNVTPIHTQSNILLDRAYREDESRGAAKHGNEKPSKITLKQYINVLMKQQHIEDERFAVLENNFANNGWCSKEDLNNIQQKRIIINKKWAERISYYQGRLEA